MSADIGDEDGLNGMAISQHTLAICDGTSSEDRVLVRGRSH